MLGVPQAERPRLAEWAVLILGALEPSLSEENFENGCRAVDDFKDYLRMLIESKRRASGKRDDFDVLGALVDAEDRWGRSVHWIGGGKLSWSGGDDCDFKAIEDGYISVTPLQTDLTDYARLEEVNEWKLAD